MLTLSLSIGQHAMSRSHALGVLMLMVTATALRGEVRGPYQADEHTLHLYHFDGEQLPLGDAQQHPDASCAFNLTLWNEATNHGTSYNGFGSALDTSGSTAAGASIRQSGYGAGKVTASKFTPDNHPTGTFWNQRTGAFTIEALVRLDFDPHAILVGRYEPMDIVDLENAGRGSSRPFQFGLRPIGVFGATTPTLYFTNVSGGGRVQSLLAVLPIDGPHTPRQGHWFHVAVTYNGDAAAQGNVKFYWTSLDEPITEANLVAKVTMRASLVGASAELSVGNNVRRFGEPQGCGWGGLIDEVRISDVARKPNEFIFCKPTANSKPQ